MPRRITIAPHLSLEELQARFRQAKTPTVAHHYQIIWLLACGKSTAFVKGVTGYSRGWIYELVWGYNNLGPESLEDRRCQNTDRDPLLNDGRTCFIVASPTTTPSGWRAMEWSQSSRLDERTQRLQSLPSTGVGISQINEVPIESTSPRASGIRPPRTGGMEKKIYTVKSREFRKNTLQAT